VLVRFFIELLTQSVGAHPTNMMSEIIPTINLMPATIPDLARYGLHIRLSSLQDLMARYRTWLHVVPAAQYKGLISI